MGLFKLVTIGAVVGGLSGCAPHMDYRGKFLEKDALAKIQIGHSDSEDVMGILGSPSAMDGFYDTAWIYDYQMTKTTSFFDPKIIERQIVVVRFNKDGIVSNINVSDKGMAVDPSPHKTPTVDDDKSALAQVFGNFGRASRKESAKEARK